MTRARAGRPVCGALLLAGVASVSLPALGADKYWVGGSGAWGEPSNWNLSGQPAQNDNAYLTAADATSRTVQYSVANDPSPVLGSLRIDATGSGRMSLEMGDYGQEYRLSAGVVDVGYSGQGTLTQSRGSLTAGTLYLAHNSGSSGNYTLGGSASLQVQGTEYVGRKGVGQFTQNGGTHTVTYTLSLGELSGSRGGYQLTDGTLSAHDIVMADDVNASASFVQSGGASRVQGDLMMAYFSPTTRADYQLSGGSLDVQGDVNVGYTGSGNFTQAGGSHVVGGTLRIGLNVGSSGTYQLDGGTLSAASISLMGAGSAFRQSAATLAVSGSFTNNGGQAVLGGTQNWATGSVYYANGGSNAFRSDAGASGAGTLRVEAAAPVTFDSTQHLAALNIKSGATVTLTSGGKKVLKAGTLVIDSASQLQLSDNALIVGSGSLQQVGDWIKSGRGGGDWTGPGIVTNASVGGKSLGLGYAAGDDPAIKGLGGKLNGESFEAGSILVKPTYLGDADLDGDVDGDDVAKWAVNFTGALTNPANPKAWTQGDWDYDGDVDGDDVAKWAVNFTGALTSGGLTINAPGASLQAIAMLENMGINVAVPEPGSLSLLAAGGLMLLRRKRR